MLQHTDPFSDLPDFFVTSKKLCIVNQLSTDTMQSSSLGTEPFRRIATSWSITQTLLESTEAVSLLWDTINFSDETKQDKGPYSCKSFSLNCLIKCSVYVDIPCELILDRILSTVFVFVMRSNCFDPFVPVSRRTRASPAFGSFTTTPCTSNACTRWQVVSGPEFELRFRRVTYHLFSDFVEVAVVFR